MVSMRALSQLTTLALICFTLRSFLLPLTLLDDTHPKAAAPPDLLTIPLPFEVEWRVAVGCGFSGFFVEVVLGFIPPLARSASTFILLCGACADTFLDSSLTAPEVAAYRSTCVDKKIPKTHVLRLFPNVAPPLLPHVQYLI